jgi:hypothetical protein
MREAATEQLGLQDADVEAAQPSGGEAVGVDRAGARALIRVQQAPDTRIAREMVEDGRVLVDSLENERVAEDVEQPARLGELGGDVGAQLVARTAGPGRLLLEDRGTGVEDGGVHLRLPSLVDAAILPRARRGAIGPLSQDRGEKFDRLYEARVASW